MTGSNQHSELRTVIGYTTREFEGGEWVRKEVHEDLADAYEGLVEQLERATSDDFSLVPKDEYARLKGIEEQLETARKERSDAVEFGSRAMERSRELEEQLEASQAALREIVGTPLLSGKGATEIARRALSVRPPHVLSREPTREESK